MTKILMTVLLMMTLTIAAGSWVACESSASLMRKDALGGRVQLHGAYMPAIGDARMLMVEHCHGHFDYEELGSAVEFQCKVNATQPSAASAELALRTGGDVDHRAAIKAGRSRSVAQRAAGRRAF